jgi:hypothetical protein
MHIYEGIVQLAIGVGFWFAVLLRVQWRDDLCGVRTAENSKTPALRKDDTEVVPPLAVYGISFHATL